MTGHEREISALEQQLDSTTEPLARLELLGKLFRLAMWEDYQKALRIARRRLAEARRTKIDREIALALLNVGSVLGLLSDDLGALKKFEQAEGLFKKIGDDNGVAAARSKRGTALIALSRAKEGIELLKLVVNSPYKEHDPASVASSHFNIGSAYKMLSDLPKALEHFFIGLDMARQTGTGWSIAHQLLGISEIYTELGDYEKAREYLEEASELYKESNLRGYCDALNHLGVVYLKLGNADRGRRLHEQVLELATQFGDSYLIADTRHFLGMFYFARRNFDEALRHFDMVLATPHTYIHAPAQVGVARIHLEQGEPARGIPYALQALDQAEEIGNRNLAAQCHQILHEGYQALGDTARSLHHYKLYRDIEEEVLGSGPQRAIREMYVRAEVERVERERRELLQSNALLRERIERNERQLKQAAARITGDNSSYEFQRDSGKQGGGNIPPGPARNWESFEMNFQQMHPEFIRRLSQRFPELTPAELKVCAFVRSNLSTKEMADMLCVEPRSVEVYRTRLRRKLGLDRSVNLSTFLGAI